jgi:hypothetical protein
MTQPKHAKKKGSGRVYEIEGVEYPSVTSVLDCLPKPALPRWAAREAAIYAVDEVHYERYEDATVGFESREALVKEIKSAPFRQRDKKAAIGSLVHSALESYLAGKEDSEIVNELKRDEIGYFYGLLHWFDSVEPQVLMSEATVVSKHHGYAGTADIICLIDGVRWCVDAKTSKGVYSSHGAQVAAYSKADWYVKDDRLEAFAGAEHGMVVKVTEDGEFTAVPFYDLTPWWNLFKAAQAVYLANPELKVPEALRV